MSAGAGIMVDEGLFRLFPCDRVFAAHNEPGMPVGHFGFRDGPLMAAADQVQITIQGKGGHGAVPEAAVDPIVIGASLVMALQTIVSRNISPHDAAVVTVGCLRSGEASNVIPDTAFLDLTVRHFNPQVGALLHRRIEEIARGQAASFGGSATFKWMNGYPVTVNEVASTTIARDAAVRLLGGGKVREIEKPYLGSEDFSFMLQKVPGSYLMMGNGEDSAPLHHPKYNFNDAAIAPGAAYWTLLTETYLKAA